MKVYRNPLLKKWNVLMVTIASWKGEHPNLTHSTHQETIFHCRLNFIRLRFLDKELEYGVAHKEKMSEEMVVMEHLQGT